MSDKIKELSFTKEHTQIAKGVAILMMLYHHLFVLPDRIHCDYFSVLNICGMNMQKPLAYFCKLCVAIFVFLSGYGLFFSMKETQTKIFTAYKKVGLRALHFLTNYWIIFLIFIPLGLAMGVYSFDIKSLFNAFFGMYTFTYTDEWWFVSVYIVMLFLFPAFNYILSSAKIYKKLIVIAVYVGIYFGLHFYITYIGNNAFIENYYEFSFKYFSPVFLIFFVGIVCAKYKVYQRIYSLFYKINLNQYVGAILLVIIAIAIRVIFSNHSSHMYYDFIVAPLFVFGISTLLIRLKKISCVLKLFGKHSTNMWLTHTFWCYYFWQPLVFAPFFSTAIYIWLIILSLATSYIINLIYIPANNLLFSKEHRLSYKGYFYYLHKKEG